MTGESRKPRQLRLGGIPGHVPAERSVIFSGIRSQPNGIFVFGFPQGSTPLAAVAAEDVGGVVAAIMAESYWYRGKVVGVVGDDRRVDEYAQIMKSKAGREIEYRHIAHDAFAAQPFPGAGELADMFEFNRQYIPNRAADLAKSRELFPQIRDFESWVNDNVTALQHALES